MSVTGHRPYESRRQPTVAPERTRPAQLSYEAQVAPDRRQELGDFLRLRREALPAEERRRQRTPGLRREDIASQSYISVDYYTRLEQGRAASMPSEAVTDALADALRLTDVERAHLHRLAGRAAPEVRCLEDVAPSLRYILRRLEGTPAHVLNDLGAVLAQSPAADTVSTWVVRQGLGAANVFERWFCDDDVRAGWPAEERSEYSEGQAGELRTAVIRRALAGDYSGYTLVDELSRNSAEFRRAWAAHPVQAGRPKRIWIAHTPFYCHTTIDELTNQRLVVFSSDAAAADLSHL